MQRKLSLSWRLTAYFASLSAVVLLAFDWVITASIDQHFTAQDRAMLSVKSAQVYERVSHIKDAESVALLPSDLSFIFANHGDLFAVVIARDGTVLYEISPADIPVDSLLGYFGKDTSDVFTWEEGTSAYRGFTQRVDTPYSELGSVIILMGLNIDHHAIFMASFKRQLLFYTLLATLVSGFLGWLAAKQGLKPLFLMRARALNVTAIQQGHRMPVDSVPVEIAGLAEALNQMLARLEDNFTRLSEFSSDIAHELRTPLSNLMTQTQVALSRPRDLESYRNVLISNSEEYERLSSMISDMLFLAKADHGLILPSYEMIDLESEIESIVEFYEPLASDKQVTLSIQGAGRIQGDHLMIRRALSNLLSNAIRYCYPESAIEISIRSQPNTVDVLIRNHGDTIAAKDLLHLFDRFYRADKNRTKNYTDGVGLGLAITKAIIVAHAGEINVTSVNNVSSFSLSFSCLPIDKH